LGGKKKIGKVGPTLEKKVIPAETDPEKLVNYVCGSCIMQKGEDVKLKPDNEYPDWLWNLRSGECSCTTFALGIYHNLDVSFHFTGKPPPFSELEHDSLDYWKRVVKMGRKHTLNLMRNKKF